MQGSQNVCDVVLPPPHPTPNAFPLLSLLIWAVLLHFTSKGGEAHGK